MDIGVGHSQYPHVIVPLIGRLKSRTGEQYYLFTMARHISAGINAGKRADFLGLLLVPQKRTKEFVLINGARKQLKIGDYNG